MCSVRRALIGDNFESAGAAERVEELDAGRGVERHLQPPGSERLEHVLEGRVLLQLQVDAGLCEVAARESDIQRRIDQVDEHRRGSDGYGARPGRSDSRCRRCRRGRRWSAGCRGWLRGSGRRARRRQPGQADAKRQSGQLTTSEASHS